MQNVAHLSRNTSFASKFQFDIRAKNTLFILATVNCQGWLLITRAVHNVSFLQIHTRKVFIEFLVFESIERHMQAAWHKGDFLRDLGGFLGL